MTDNGATKARKILIVGALIILAGTILSQAMAILTMIFANSPDYKESFWEDVVYTLRTVFDSVIFASGAALVVTSVRFGNKNMRLIAYFSALLILFFDYGISFVIDYAYGLIDGYEGITLLYLLMNLVARAVIYGLILTYSVSVYKKSGAGQSPIPFISAEHPTSKMVLSIFLVRIVPYVLFEVYSNVTGIIEYGFDMTGADILSIISAYAEIFIDGALIYCAAYLLIVLYSNMSKNTENA